MADDTDSFTVSAPPNEGTHSKPSQVDDLSDNLTKLATLDSTENASNTTPQGNATQIDADMMQIDSILKALNSGTFDQGNMMTIDQLTAKTPKNVISAVQLAPSGGLGLIGQLSSGEDDSSSSDSEDSDDELADRIISVVESDDETRQLKGKHGYPMVKGEVDYRDLPPPEGVIVEECPASVELSSVGTIKSVTENLIVIESSNNSPHPLDEDTVLWDSNRQAIGKLFEIFGPVKKPFYSIRIGEDTTMQPGELVFAALGESNFTNFAFPERILRQKGSDASWKNDEEVPVEYQDFSDDEKETLANKEKRKAFSARKSSTRSIENTSVQSAVKPNKIHDPGVFRGSYGVAPPSYPPPVHMAPPPHPSYPPHPPYPPPPFPPPYPHTHLPQQAYPSSMAPPYWPPHSQSLAPTNNQNNNYTSNGYHDFNFS